jgi:hypothetical protein
MKADIKEDIPVVAFYDFRGKQEYIYRTNKVKEIIGASEIMRSAYQDFIKDYNSDSSNSRHIKSDLEGLYASDAFLTGNDDGEVLYEGGGNITIIFRNEKLCRSFNRDFSLWLVKKTYSLSLLCSFVVLDECDDVSNVKFRAIREALAKKSGYYKRILPLQTFANVLPFTQIDRKTALPIVEKVEEESFSQESVLKLAAYKTSLTSVGGGTDSVAASAMPWIGSIEFTRNFDKMVTEKGVESLLAVIYIDGNEMGTRVKGLIPEDISLDEGVNRMRRFTKEINDVFVRRPLNKIIEAERELERENAVDDKDNSTRQQGGNTKKGKPVIAVRQIVSAGDEITLVCNARKALDIVKLYFESLSETNAAYREGCGLGENYSNYSACAGITLFHSHAPFTVAYEIAEKCCKNGKKRRRTLLKNAGVSVRESVEDNCYLDFFFMMSGVTDELDNIRSQQYCDCTNVPYCITGNDSEHALESFDDIKKQMVGAGRANAGALQSAALKSETELSVEIERIRSKISGFLQKEIEKEGMPQIRKIVHDVATVYDVWFRGEEA